MKVIKVFEERMVESEFAERTLRKIKFPKSLVPMQVCNNLIMASPIIRNEAIYSWISLNKIKWKYVTLNDS